MHCPSSTIDVRNEFIRARPNVTNSALLYMSHFLRLRRSICVAVLHIWLYTAWSRTITTFHNIAFVREVSLRTYHVRSACLSDRLLRVPVDISTEVLKSLYHPFIVEINLPVDRPHQHSAASTVTYTSSMVMRYMQTIPTNFFAKPCE